jgi:hypothetical protein
VREPDQHAGRIQLDRLPIPRGVAFLCRRAVRVAADDIGRGRLGDDTERRRRVRQPRERWNEARGGEPS